MLGQPSVLITDLYQITMANAYFESGMRESAVFELFVRRMPRTRRFLVAAGLEQVLRYLTELRFTAQDIEFLGTLGSFPQRFLDHLGSVRFTGSVSAVPEGTPFFPNEPILRITAPILEAQLVESRIVNLMHLQTMIASKAARCTLTAHGRRLIDFGMRRAHGAEAAVYAARAAFLAGFDATATIEAGREFGIPLSGTMAHSFIEAHDREEEALRGFVAARGGDSVMLIDTYDTARGARRVAALARQMKAENRPGRIRGVRIDSGDLATQARMVRGILDAEGCPDIEITLSGSLDEYGLQALLAAGAPVNAFGVGTHLDVSQDAPSLDMIYKLEEYAGRPRRKRSPGKETWPGCKQVFRERDADGTMTGDSLALIGERPVGEPLLREVLRDGRRVGEAPSLADSREFCRQQLATLPMALRSLEPVDCRYPVRVSDALHDLAREVDLAER